MRTLILCPVDDARAVCAALNAADPVGAPYTMLRQVSETDEDLALVGVHIGWSQDGLVDRLARAARAAGAEVYAVPDRAELELERRGLRFRPPLPEEPPTRHADVDALDAKRHIATSGTIANRWDTHQQDGRRLEEAGR